MFASTRFLRDQYTRNCARQSSDCCEDFAVPRAQQRQMRNFDSCETESQRYGEFCAQNQTFTGRHLISGGLNGLLQGGLVSDPPSQSAPNPVGQWLRTLC